eukprot:CAMPEP_0194488516 /NCGR_PEP_ID=MMETSP0253-20130528/8412_1 /TAXON_ID=2966 /ORGANISM="Noctiluca scintillans" /LENGTH=43 /DNA_ID= /DNA_START= /DNA_END= /DNA_ORIENTATION=
MAVNGGIMQRGPPLLVNRIRLREIGVVQQEDTNLCVPSLASVV